MPRIITDLYIPHPCASVLSVGATICSLILILPQMPRIIRFIYPTSVLSVGDTICILILILPQMPRIIRFFLLDYGFF